MASKKKNWKSSMTKQVYTEIPVTWVGYQWDGDISGLGMWVLNNDEDFSNTRRVTAVPTDPKVYADPLHPTEEEISKATYERVFVATPYSRRKGSFSDNLFSGVLPTSDTAKLGEWILYSPQLNEYKVVDDDEFHRRFTAKV